jgi:hypothetical protein
MVSVRQFGQVLGLITGLVLLSEVALAQDPVGRFAKLLGDAGDFRVRTQAALALGAAKQKGAVDPLCRALSDPSAAVRAAAATALRRLALGGAPCLRERLALEENQLAKSAIQRALENLANAEPPPAPISAATRHYVAVGPIKDLPQGSQGLERQIVVALRRAAPQTFAFAPAGESPTDAQTLLAKHPGVKGFYLAPKLVSTYAAGALTVRIEVAMFSYPDKALLGSFSVRAQQGGLAEDNVKGRDDLIKAVAEGAIQKFAKAVPGL